MNYFDRDINDSSFLYSFILVPKETSDFDITLLLTHPVYRRCVNAQYPELAVCYQCLRTIYRDFTREPFANAHCHSAGKTFSIRVSFAYQAARICSAINPTFDLVFSPLYIRHGYQTIYIPFIRQFCYPALVFGN